MATECKSKVCNPGGVPQTVTPPAAMVIVPTPQIVEGCNELIVSDDDLKKYMDIFLDNIKRGLAKDTNPDCAMKCFPTYVQDLPDGTETGKFLALDLGGSNFRVLLIELVGGECKMDHINYIIPPELMVGPGVDLFDFIAKCLAEFAKEKGVAEEVLPLGFTFSFPLIQKGLTVGVLEMWTKGFNCTGVVGEDVVKLLNEAIARRDDVKIDICAVLNDTTGTLMSCAWYNKNTRIGLIVGTGTNGCYVEKQANSELFDEPDRGSGNVIINLESGAFGDDGSLDFIRVGYDKIVDEESINPGKHLHEKMISGMYLGDVARLVIKKFTEQGLMFGGVASEPLNTSYAFNTRYISEIEADPAGTYENAKRICQEMGLSDATEQDYVNMRFICERVSVRAAHLVSAMLAALMVRMDEPKICVGIDGTVYRSHPKFHDLMMAKIKEFIPPHFEYELMLSEDGSGRGAALVAAVAARVKAASSA